MTGTTKRLSIILPSYNDPRIEHSIASIRRFDDIDSVKILVIDGGSKQEITTLIKASLSSSDVFVSEPDKGIFDALNKGLRACDTEFLGWLGSDDQFTHKVRASEVVAALEGADLFVASTAFVRNGRVTRVIHATPSRLGLIRIGLHNPHYATFGRSALLKTENFELELRGSDIEYFIRIFAKSPQVTCTNVVATLQGEGGFSNSSVLNILRTNFELLSVYARHTNWLLAPIAVMTKLGYKLASTAYYKAVNVTASRLM